MKFNSASVVRFAFLFLALGIASTRGVIHYSTGDSDANTSAPSGDLASSGWQFQGEWAGHLGTPIASQFFITAKHIGGGPGGSILFGGQFYQTTAFFDDPTSDLRLWRICGSFPIYASLYTNSDEQGKNFVVFGRGTQRGEEVIANGELKGWRWGAGDGRMRWGENQIAEIVSPQQAGFGGSGQNQRNLLKATFDANGRPNEAHLSFGDSAGGLFIRDGSEWKLAGINYAVQGPFNTESQGEGFSAAIFDIGGLYEKSGQNWILRTPSTADRPSAFFVSRISTSIDWINEVLASSQNQSGLMLQSASSASGPYTDELSASHSLESQTILLPLPGEARFYRLKSACDSTRISSARIDSGMLEFRYSRQ